MTENTRTIRNPEKANNTKTQQNKTTRRIWHSARKRYGLILQHSWAHHTGSN